MNRKVREQVVVFGDEQIFEAAMHKIEASAGSSAIASVLWAGTE